MRQKILQYYLSLHGCSENTKENYVERLKLFGEFLLERGNIKKFEDANRLDIDLFLSKYKSEGTKNLLILIIKNFYKFIGKTEVTKHLKFYRIRLEQLTPSETLTLDEVVALANEAGKKREMNKVLVLTLYESCARISRY
jgi:site-specific recombinase XerD